MGRADHPRLGPAVDGSRRLGRLPVSTPQDTHRDCELSVLAVASVGVTVGDLVQQGIVVAAVLILTGSGIGSVLGWAVRMMLSHLATVGALAVRALPVVLLTALVFFNTYVWLMAATIAATGWDWPWRSWSPSLRRSSPRPPESASGRCCNRRRCRATNPKSSRPHRSPRCPAPPTGRR